FTFNQSKEIGFVSSNRAGEDNIYYVHPICGRDAFVIVKDAKTGEVLANASVSILDDKKNTIESQTTSEKGTTNFYTECKKEYALQASEPHDGRNAVVLASCESGCKTESVILVTPIEVIGTVDEVMLNPSFFEFDKSNITVQGAPELDKLVKVMT